MPRLIIKHLPLTIVAWITNNGGIFHSSEQQCYKCVLCPSHPPNLRRPQFWWSREQLWCSVLPGSLEGAQTPTDKNNFFASLSLNPHRRFCSSWKINLWYSFCIRIHQRWHRARHSIIFTLWVSASPIRRKYDIVGLEDLQPLLYLRSVFSPLLKVLI